MIVPAHAEDAAKLNELVNSAYRGDTSRAGWTSEANLFDGTRIDLNGILDILNRPGFLILKYVEENRLMGCVELHRDGSKLYLGMLSVRPGQQGNGIGKKLLQAAEDEAVRQKCHAIFMTVISQRKELMDWYFRHGYTDTGKRKPFDTSDKRHGIPKMELELAVLEKPIVQAP